MLLFYVLGLDMSHVTLIKGATATLLHRVSYIANLSELTSSYMILPISLVFVCRPSIYPFIDSRGGRRMAEKRQIVVRFFNAFQSLCVLTNYPARC